LGRSDQIEDLCVIVHDDCLVLTRKINPKLPPDHDQALILLISLTDHGAGNTAQMEQMNE
jgi:hypothetical protein